MGSSTIKSEQNLFPNANNGQKGDGNPQNAQEADQQNAQIGNGNNQNNGETNYRPPFGSSELQNVQSGNNDKPQSENAGLEGERVSKIKTYYTENIRTEHSIRKKTETWSEFSHI